MSKIQTPEIVTSEELDLAKELIKEARKLVGLDGLMPMDLHPDSFACREAFAKALRYVSAQIRAEAAEEKRQKVVADLRKMYGPNPQERLTLIDNLRIASLQPAKLQRDKRALEVAHSIAERFHIHGCDDIADLLAANVKEWREK